MHAKHTASKLFWLAGIISVSGILRLRLVLIVVL